jgi:hypothetical protein
MRLLYPWMRLKEYAAPQQSMDVLRIGIVTEMMETLGMGHPFDTE